MWSSTSRKATMPAGNEPSRIIATARTIALLLVIVLSGCGRQEPPGAPQSVENLRGEPIQSPPAVADSVATGVPPAVKKKYPKPVSFQRRMVEYYAGRTNGAPAEPLAGFATSPVQPRFTREQLEAMEGPRLP